MDENSNRILPILILIDVQNIFLPETNGMLSSSLDDTVKQNIIRLQKIFKYKIGSLHTHNIPDDSSILNEQNCKDIKAYQEGKSKIISDELKRRLEQKGIASFGESLWKPVDGLNDFYIILTQETFDKKFKRGLYTEKLYFKKKLENLKKEDLIELWEKGKLLLFTKSGYSLLSNKFIESFFDNVKRHFKDFILTFYIAGVAAEKCVIETANHLKKYGEVKIIENAIAFINEQEKENFAKQVKENNLTLIRDIEPVGIIVGGGSGKVLSEAFINFLLKVGEEFKQDFIFYVNDIKPALLYRKKFFNPEEEFEYKLPTNFKYPIFSTHSFRKNYSNIEEEVKKIIELLDVWRGKRIKYIFRTALDADIIYKLREKVKALKIVESHINNKKVRIFRDEIQGFYTNDKWNYDKEKEKIIFYGHFKKENFKELLSFLKERNYIQDNQEVFYLIYKHHLFRGFIEKWLKEILKLKKNNNYEIILQPDTGLTNFLNLILNETHKTINLLVGNEVGDVLEELISSINGNFIYKLALYTVNYYFEYPNFIIYQTVHGSADDRIEKNIYPLAALRIAKDILKRKIPNRLNDNVFKRQILETFRKNYQKKGFNMTKYNFNIFYITNNITQKIIQIIKEDNQIKNHKNQTYENNSKKNSL